MCLCYVCYVYTMLHSYIKKPHKIHELSLLQYAWQSPSVSMHPSI